MNRIGILGGTFNPIHIGHIKLAKAAYEALNLNKVLIMPTGISYLKAGTNVLDKTIRSELVKISIKEYDFLEYSDVEIIREGNTYTYETLLDLNKSNPGIEYYYIIGADTLFSIESWKRPDLIFENCTLVAMVRDEYSFSEMEDRISYLKGKYKAKIELLDSPKFDISSTLIRESFQSGNSENVKKYLTDDAYKYIVDNKLYI